MSYTVCHIASRHEPFKIYRNRIVVSVYYVFFLPPPFFVLLLSFSCPSSPPPHASFLFLTFIHFILDIILTHTHTTRFPLFSHPLCPPSPPPSTPHTHFLPLPPPRLCLPTTSELPSRPSLPPPTPSPPNSCAYVLSACRFSTPLLPPPPPLPHSPRVEKNPPVDPKEAMLGCTARNDQNPPIPPPPPHTLPHPPNAATNEIGSVRSS